MCRFALVAIECMRMQKKTTQQSRLVLTSHRWGTPNMLSQPCSLWNHLWFFLPFSYCLQTNIDYALYILCYEKNSTFLNVNQLRRRHDDNYRIIFYLHAHQLIPFNDISTPFFRLTELFSNFVTLIWHPLHILSHAIFFIVPVLKISVFFLLQTLQLFNYPELLNIFTIISL